MKMNRKERVDGYKIKNTYFPNLGKAQERILDEWEGPYSFPYLGHNIIAKVLTMAGYDDFKEKKYDIIDDTSFKIYTKEDKPIKIDLTYCTVDDPSKVIITEDDKVDHYEVISIVGTEDLLVIPERTEDLSNRFIQYYDSRYDSFTKNDNGIKIHVSIGRNDDSNTYDFYYINDNIKQEFINTRFNNILEVYKFIKERIDMKSRVISITYENTIEFDQTDKMRIINGVVDELTISTEIEESKSLPQDNQNELLNGLIKEASTPGKRLQLTIK